jgi:hypothetical protein
MGHTVDRKAVAEAATEVSCPGAAAASAYIGAADLEAPFMASLLSEFYTPLSSQPALCFDPTLLIYILKKKKKHLVSIFYTTVPVPYILLNVSNPSLYVHLPFFFVPTIPYGKPECKNQV